jgi:putative ABC transport system permease protein
MLRNYFKVGIRNLLKYKGFTFINAFGLGLAMSVGMLIILMLADHGRYDRFHTNKEKIYRILSDKENSKVPSATTPFSLAQGLENYPIIEETTHLTRGVASDFVFDGRISEARGYFSDPGLFKIFDFELIEGNESNALASPNSIVVTSSFARKIFNDASPLGKVIELRNPEPSGSIPGSEAQARTWGTYTITGVISDENKSHLLFDILVSSSSREILIREKKVTDQTNDWANNQSYTYVLLAGGATKDQLSASLKDLITHKEETKHIKGFTLIPQRLTDITPGILVSNESRPNLPLVAYYFLAALAVVILISACLNYTNLSIARSITRSKEIGIRKVTGAFRKDLIQQFLGEGMITSLIALAIASILLVVIREAILQSWINEHLQFDLEVGVSVCLAFIVFAVFIGILSAIYPALYLSKFRPVHVLKNINAAGPRKFGLRKLLAVCQFSVSLFFIITSLLLVSQFKHFMDIDYGFEPKNIVNVKLQGNDYRKVASAFSSIAGVSTISACNYIPSTGTNNGISLRSAGTDNDFRLATILLTDHNFLETFGIELIAGSHLPASDSTTRFVLVNEAAVYAFGYSSPAGMIGQVLESERDGEDLEVIGVTRNFFVRAPFGGERETPVVLRSVPHAFSYVNVKLIASERRTSIKQLEAIWKGIDTQHPFEYDLYEEQLSRMNNGLVDLISLIGFFAAVSVTIACLGLLGMCAYISARKKKEVGIRKILGADVAGLALLLSQDFLKILGVSVVVGAPLSFIVNNLWLERLPNRVEFGFTTIFVGTMFLLILGFLTIGSQTVRASRQNPVEALRTE